MSTEHKPLTSRNNKAVSLTSFHGGQGRGRCLQLTQGMKSVQLDAAQVAELIEALEQWQVNDLGGDPGGCLAGRPSGCWDM